MKFLDGAEPPQRTRLAPRHLPRPHRATPLGQPATHKTTNSSKMLSPTKGKHDECQTAARRITPADPRQTEGRGHNAKLTSREPRPMSERTERVEVKRSSAPRRGRGGTAPCRLSAGAERKSPLPGAPRPLPGLLISISAPADSRLQALEKRAAPALLAPAPRPGLARVPELVSDWRMNE